MITREFQEEIDQISEAMNSTWQKVIFGSVTSLVVAGLSIAEAGFSDNPMQTLTGLTIGSLSLINAVYQATDSWKQIVENQMQPLAYAAFAKRSFKK